MNIKDVVIKSNESGFRTLYRDCAILWTNVHYNLSTIEIYYNENDIITYDLSGLLELGVYNSQFGILLTDDCSKFFVQSWETGLFCFETQTGNLLWHIKQKRASHLATDKNSVICHFSSQCVSKIDSSTGTVLYRYSFTCGTTFMVLSSKYYLVGPKRNQYEILNGDLEIQARVSIARLNPNSYDCFLIQNATLKDGHLIISGEEYFSEEMRKARRNKCSDRLLERSRFERTLQVYIY